jgi:NAD(P)-dependent dehydrogenase (short-subunit alcohol dehydrogenase family)
MQRLEAFKLYFCSEQLLQRPFNFAALNNRARQHCSGNFLLFLNNDIRFESPAPIEALLDPFAMAKLGVPLGVPAQAEEIANGVLFLASDASRHMTGAEFVIDGGMTAGTVRRPD